MNQFKLITVLILLICSLTSYGLEPSKVAYYTNNTAAQNVYIELKDYTSNTLLFRGETFSLAPNDNGIVIVNVNDYPAGGSTGDWSGINASVINTFTLLDIYVNGTLFSQKRYDQLILIQAEATVLDNSGNFNPQTLNGTIGADDNRWDDVYVGGSTLHIGPDNGELNNTEMELSYSANTGVISVNSTDALSLTPTNVTVSSLTGTGNRIVSANSSGLLSATTGLPTGDLVGTTATQTLTNKSIDADNNSITNIENADIKSNAGIDATKLADGSVTSTELQYINSTTSNVQTQLDGKQATITAGNGLSFATNTLNAGGSSTILSNATNLEVNSSATANQVLLSSGTAGTAAVYGSLPLGDANSVSGTLSVTNGGTGATTLATGNFLQGNGTSAVTAVKAVPTGDVVGSTDTQTLTNKSIDADNNTITNIENSDIKAGAAIDATKLADGSVTSTELQFINSVTSNVQTQLDGKQGNLPSQSGNSGRYLTTDGTNLSWATVAGGGGGATASTDTPNSLTLSSTYQDTGIEFTLAANTVYQLFGYFQVNETGSGKIDTRINYTGTFTSGFFDGDFGYDATNFEDLNSSVLSTPYRFIGTIVTNTAGTLKIQIQNNPTSTGTNTLDGTGLVTLVVM